MAAPVVTAIKFRSLMDQLTKQEFTQFMNKLYDLNKSSMIKTSLFNYFTQTIHKKNNSDSQDLENINAILCNIIQSRKKKPKALPITNIKLNELPKSIIGHTASFLEQDDYFQFEQTNRSIFIGCNAPNMLIQLDLFFITDYSSINLSKFRSLQKLRIDIRKFNEFILPNNGQIIMKQLNELWLNADYKKDFEIESFLKQNCINMTNIKTLKLFNFGDIGEGNRFNVDKMYQLLTKFPNVQYLDLYNIFLASRLFNASKLKKLYPHLKGLSVNAGSRRISNALVNEFGNNLYFLSYNHGIHPWPSTDFSNINFNKLQEIKLEGPATKTINDVLKTGKNIQKFALDPHVHFNNKISLTEQELTNIIPQILKCKSLTYFEIEANHKNCIAILDGIEKGLFETRKWERKQITIRVCARKKSKINIKEIIFNIGRIINWLLSESSNIKDFMFIFEMNKIDQDLKKQLDVVDLLNDLNNMASNIQVLVDELLFLITNKNCQINGFGPRWMMKRPF